MTENFINVRLSPSVYLYSDDYSGGRPHTVHPIAEINNVEDLALMLLISVLSLNQVFIFRPKYFKQSLCYTLYSLTAV